MWLTLYFYSWWSLTNSFVVGTFQTICMWIKRLAEFTKACLLTALRFWVVNLHRFKSLCTLLYSIESMHALSKWMTANLAWQTWRHNGVRLFLFAGSAGASDVQVPLSASNACTLISRVLNFPPFFIHFGHLIGDKWFDVMIYWSWCSTTARDDRS